MVKSIENLYKPGMKFCKNTVIDSTKSNIIYFWISLKSIEYFIPQKYGPPGGVL